MDSSQTKFDDNVDDIYQFGNSGKKSNTNKISANMKKNIFSNTNLTNKPNFKKFALNSIYTENSRINNESQKNINTNFTSETKGNFLSTHYSLLDKNN